MSTLGDVVRQLSASCDELARANRVAVAAQDHLEQAIRRFGAAADGSGDDRVREVQHRVQEASTAAGEAARGLIHGNAAIETYLAQIAPALARDSGPVPLPPVTGGALLDIRIVRKRDAAGLVRAAIKDISEVNDVSEKLVSGLEKGTRLRELLTPPATDRGAYGARTSATTSRGTHAP